MPYPFPPYSSHVSIFPAFRKTKMDTQFLQKDLGPEFRLPAGKCGLVTECLYRHLATKLYMICLLYWVLSATCRFLLFDIFFRGVEQKLQFINWDWFAFTVNCLTVIQFGSQYNLLMLFSTLSDTELHALRPHCCFHHFTKGDVIWDMFIIDKVWCITLTIPHPPIRKNPG